MVGSVSTSGSSKEIKKLRKQKQLYGKESKKFRKA